MELGIPHTVVVDPSSEFEEEYLEALYNLGQDGEPVKTGVMADYFRLSPAAITEMVQKLAAKGLVDYVKYKGASLTEEGRRIAARIRRRHELAELWLRDVLKLPSEEIHPIACRMEHVMSVNMEQALCDMLGNPTVNADGEPSAPCSVSHDCPAGD